MTIGGHTVREHQEAINHAAAYSLMLELARGQMLLMEETICALHAAITKGLLDKSGIYHTGAVFISGSEHRPPHHSQVPGVLHDLTQWIVSEGLTYDAVTRASLTHEMLLAIHPFANGNGRTARLILNRQLI